MTTSGLSVVENTNGGPTVTDEDLELVRSTVARNATTEQLKLYLYDCRRQRVHPLDRLLHCTIRGGKYVPITSIDLMRSRAAETGEYAGQDDAVIIWNTRGDTPYPEAATVSVYRIVQGQRVAFVATARWNEYKPDNYAGLWDKMPSVMISKCAEALALRKGFPTQLAGLYEQAELDQAIVSGDITEADPASRHIQATPVAPVSAPDDPFGSLDDEEAFPPREDSVVPEVDTPPTGRPTTHAGRKISAKQAGRLYGILRDSQHDRFDGIDLEGRKEIVLKYVATMGYETIEDLHFTGSRSQEDSDYDTVCSWIGPS